MTEEYRQDDITDRGYCPICGEPVTTVYVDGAGWCPDHGRVWCDWSTASGTHEIWCASVQWFGEPTAGCDCKPNRQEDAA